VKRLCFQVVWVCGCAALSAWAANPSLTTEVRPDPHTGKLVRTVVVHNPAALHAAVDQVASANAVPPELVQSVIRAESNYNPNALSPKGARGLMQLVPSTARRFGVVDASNPLQNLQGGTKYLKYLLDLYHGDYTLALAAYNAGEQSVARYKGVPPYPETQKYVVQIEKRFAPTRPPQAPKADAKPPAASGGGNHVQEIVLPDGSVRYISQQPL
jgi:soluble lytic murein transglycosylase-like protein